MIASGVTFPPATKKVPSLSGESSSGQDADSVGAPTLEAVPGEGPPRIALYKSWREPMEAGWTRWLFDQYGLAYDTLKDARVQEGDLLRDYDVILFHAQTPASMSSGVR